MATIVLTGTATPHAEGSDIRSASRPRLDWRYLLYFYLHAVGFVATTLLLSWGAFVLFFLAIGGFSIDGMMAHLHNLALRYVAADAHRQMAFKELIGGVQMILAIGFLVFRRHAFRPFRDFDRSTPHG